MKTLIIKSENANEDNEAALEINREMVRGDCEKIIWYSSFGKDILDLKSMIDRLSNKVVLNRKEVEPIEKEVKRLCEELNKMNEQMETCKTVEKARK